MDYWTQTPDEVAKTLGVDLAQGLTPDARAERLAQSTARVKPGHPAVRAFLAQFKSPIQLLLVAAACLSFSLGQPVDGTVVLLIILGSAVISFQHEYHADQAVKNLMKLVETKVKILQNGQTVEIPSASVVPGDVILVDAGSIIPADGLLIASTNLFTDEAALTGETFPVEKVTGTSKPDDAISERKNVLFSGSHVASGAGRFLAVQVGPQTEIGRIAKGLTNPRPEPDFERGIRRFGLLLVNLTILLTLGVFAINAFLGRSILDSFLFALALAVGLTPQLLPAIISVNLSRGAVEMAKREVIVKRLSAIESIGSMDVLCSDKTGTLTLGEVRVHGAYDLDGKESAEVLRLAQINALLQSGYRNPIDEALAASAPNGLTKSTPVLAEIPYDFVRKRLSVLVQDGEPILISKGALDPIRAVCTQAQSHSDDGVQALFQSFSRQGYRVLGVATKPLPAGTTAVTTQDEAGLTLAGMIVLEDPLRPEIADTVAHISSLGVELKVITGDNHLVAQTLGERLGFADPTPLTGKEIQTLSDAALVRQAADHQVFAEIEPNQKARLIAALKHGGKVVGYIGDGINDGGALHTADAGISVANAVDVAKEAADFVMLKPGLDVIVNAIIEGRRTFANTMKYIFMATSANFGNMFSLAGASLLVPFLPLLPKQVLMMNLLTDIPEMFIASDTVDEEQLQKPQRWNLAFLRTFMIVFGILSSAFDFATFGALLALKAPESIFRTGWFIESIVSAALIVLVIRSRRSIFKTRPGQPLLIATLAIIGVVLLLPLSPLASPLGLHALTPKICALVAAIVLAYFASAELTKHVFYRMVGKAH
ncbi:MAG: magnesium-translocating P-type ATPase [Armatimonadetes bacterium]|nr:magnesium-translocating P-type ATPase [Armatimonadota bacterium]